MFEKNTPRDFVLHAGAFIILYLGAVALITLLFAVINYVYPDPLFGAYMDPYSASMRFSIASLVVMTPILVYLFYVIQTASRKDPERKSIGVRKWLTYITLLVTGGTIIGDLIVLLNNLLGGELAGAFLMKVFVIFGVMGAGFMYFYLDIKGYWLKNAVNSRYVGMGVLAIVAVSIVGGMILLGSPMKQRELRFDHQQLNDLSILQSQILSYRQQAGELPASIAVLANGPYGSMLPESPEGRPEYQYTVTSLDSFELCATFAEPAVSDEYSKAIEPALGMNSGWEHEAGPVCFERSLDPTFFKPMEVMTVPAQ